MFLALSCHIANALSVTAFPVTFSRRTNKGKRDRFWLSSYKIEKAFPLNSSFAFINKIVHFRSIDCLNSKKNFTEKCFYPAAKVSTVN